MKKKLKIHTDRSRIKSLNEDQRLIHIPIDGNIYASFKEKEEDPDQKTDWIWNLIATQRNYTVADKNKRLSHSSENLSFNHIYRSGYAWLEPFEGSPTNKTKNGYIVQGIDEAKIYGIEWYRFINENTWTGPRIPKGTEMKFGEAVQLHIYTRGLYGTQLKIELLDYDTFSANDDLDLYPKKDGEYEGLEADDPEEKIPQNSFKAFTRQVLAYPYDENVHPPVSDSSGKNENRKISPVVLITQGEKGKVIKSEVQKAVVDVYIDPKWRYTAMNSGKLKIFCRITVPGKEPVTFDGNNEILLVQDTEDTQNSYLAQTYGNKPVVLSQVDLNLAHFQDCTLLTVKGKAGKTERQIFPRETEGENTLTNLQFPFVTGIREKRKKILLSITSRTEECRYEGTEKDHHGHVVDISGIINKINKGEGVRTRGWKLIDTEKVIPANLRARKMDSTSQASGTQPKESTLSHILKFKNGDAVITMQESYAVLRDYTPFKLEDPTDEKLELEIGYDYSFGNQMSPFKGLLNCFFPTHSSVVQNYPVVLRTCAYPNLPLHIQAYPDVKWTVQLGFNYDKNSFNKLRTQYHKDWELTEVILDEELKRLQKKDKKKPGKDANLTQKIEDKKLERDRAHSKNTPFGKVKYLKDVLTNEDGKMKCALTLRAEFDGNRQQLDLTTGFEEFLTFVRKIAKLVDLVQSVIEGNNEETTKSTPKDTKKLKNREKNLKEKLDKKKKGLPAKGKSNLKFEFLPPSLAVSLSWQAAWAEDKKYPEMGTLITLALSASPLFGFELKYDLYHLLYKIRHPAVLAVVATLDILDEALGDNFDIDLDLIVTGKISGEVAGTLHTAGGSSYTERLKNGGKSPGEIKGEITLKIKGYLQANGKVDTLLFGEYTAYAELEASVETGFSMKGEVKADAQGLFIEPELVFNGLLFDTGIKAGAVKYNEEERDRSISNIKDSDGLHWKTEGKLVAMDPYKWPLKDWRIPLLTF